MTIDNVPKFAFWMLGCSALAGNACEMLRLAGQPVTLGTARLFVAALPRTREAMLSEAWQRGYANECLEAAFTRTLGTADEARFNDLAEFFLDYFPTRRDIAQDMLLDAFEGICGALRLDKEV